MSSDERDNFGKQEQQQRSFVAIVDPGTCIHFQVRLTAFISKESSQVCSLAQLTRGVDGVLCTDVKLSVLYISD